jgi:lipoate-protein ligase A
MVRLLVDLIPSAPRDGLALEEALLESVSAGGPDTLRLWVNQRAVVLGRSQSAAAEVDLERAQKLGIPVLRRLSGGGAVYHYPGNLNLSLYFQQGCGLGGVEAVFSLFGEAIVSGLMDLGVEASVCGSGLFVGSRKLAGAAQARRGLALLYHTTLLLEADAVPMKELLRAMQGEYHPVGVPSFPHPVITLTQVCDGELDREGVVQVVSERIASRLGRKLYAGHLATAEIGRAEELARIRYGSDQWNRYR